MMERAAIIMGPQNDSDGMQSDTYFITCCRDVQTVFYKAIQGYSKTAPLATVVQKRIDPQPPSRM